MPNLEKKSQPSQSEIRESWERCGFTFTPFAPQFDEPGKLKVYFVHEPSGELTRLDDDPDTNLPFIDLNNLFRYAVPKLSSYQIRTILSDWIEEIVLLDKFDDKECALALFWALWQVKEVINGNQRCQKGRNTKIIRLVGYQ